MPDRNPPPGYTDLADAERADRDEEAPPAAPPEDRAEEDPPPIRPLGRRRAVYYFLTQAGELLALRKQEFSRNGIKALFDGDLAWLRQNFQVFDKDGKPKSGSWSDDAAGTWLMRACARAGLFDPETPLRGPGVWRDPQGRLLVHCGDALWSAEAGWHAPGYVQAGTIYAAAPPTARPRLGQAPAGVEVGRRLLEQLELWNYESALGARLLRGFLGAAMLGGAPLWRVHCLIMGRYGSGKSWLCDLCKAALGGGAIDANNVTEAALRQAFTNQARTLVLDEQESDEHSAARIQAVIGLLRLMTGGAGVKALRGSPSGQATSYSVTGTALLAAILPPTLTPHDRSRIHMITLEPLAEGPSAGQRRQAALDAIVWAGEASAGLRGRMIQSWARFQDSFDVFRAAFMGKGIDGRDADRIATLLAADDVLQNDYAIAGDEIEDLVLDCLELIEQAAEHDEDGEGQACWRHLLTSLCEVWDGNQRRQVADLLMGAAMGDDGASDRKQLQKVGLRFDHPKAAPLREIAVANDHVALQRIFQGTRWAGGRWRHALRYLPGTRASKGAVRFAGVQARATILAADHLPVDDWTGPAEGGPEDPETDLNETEVPM